MTDRPNPARIVADADVLAADLLLGGDSRAVMDTIRSHSWIELIASDALLADAKWVIETCASTDLATAWVPLVDRLRVPVDHPGGDHPAIASAYHGNAAHVLTFDETLRSAEAGARLRQRVATSVKAPGAFRRMFDPAAIHDVVVGGAYPGPDRYPRE